MNASDIKSWGTTLPDQLYRLIEQYFVSRNPKVPVKVPRFDSTSLPNPADCEGCLIYCPDTQDFRGSDGSSWVTL